ncbi:MAG: hypothetical protein Q8865_03480 [Bacillota bacterium]|nr:hypothetical protein [Bacillota bacterium]
MNFNISEVTQRYCPVIKSNVLFQTARNGDSCSEENCLNSHICNKEFGGCQNSYCKNRA